MSMPKSSQGMYPMYGLVEAPLVHRLDFWLALGAGVLLTIFCIIIFLWLRSWWRRKKQTPWESALSTLAVLARRTPQTPQEAQQLYVELTALLKKYLSTMHGLALHAATDDELLQALPQGAVAPELRVQLEDIMGRAVTIKFAQAHERTEQIAKDLETSTRLVKATMPKSGGAK